MPRKLLLFTLLILMLFATISHAAIMKYQDTVQQRDGRVVANAVVSVTVHGTSTAATLYSDDTGATPIGSTVTTNSSGIFSFYVNEGRYDISIAKSGMTTQSHDDVWIFAGGDAGAGVTYCPSGSPTNGQTIEWVTASQCYRGIDLPDDSAIVYCVGFEPLNGQTLQWDTAGQCFKGYTASGFGDVIGASDSSDSELPLFSGGGGKTIKRSNALSGIPKLTAGVVSIAGVSDYVSPTLYSSSTVTGLLTPTDWTTFNGKLATNGSGASLTGITYTQVGAQAAAANLTSLSSPGIWKMFHSNGSSAIAEIAFGSSGGILASTGVSSAPSFTSTIALPKSSGVAGQSCLYTSYLTDLFGICTEGPADTRAANLILKYPDGNPTTGQAIVYAAPDGNGVAQGSWVDTALSSSTTTTGLTGFLYSGGSGSNLAAQSYTINNGIITATTPTYHKCTTALAVTASSDWPIERFDNAVTITKIVVYQKGATDVVGGLDECTGTGGACSTLTAIDSDITGTSEVEARDDTSLTNASIAAGNRVYWHTTSVTGTNEYFEVCFYYTIN